MLVLTVLVFGLISFARLPRSLMPNISYPSITVRTEYPGASPLDVETRVSRRLEEVLSQVRGLRLVTSVSRVEMSDIILEFSWGSNMSLTTIDVREKIEQVVLPKEALKPTILRYDPTSDPILQIGVVRTGVSPESEEQALIELRRYTEEEIEKELLQVERIAAVKVRGGLEQEYRVDVVESKLRDYGLDLNLINERLLQENLNQASGFLYDGEQSFVVRTVNEFEDIEEIREVILKRDGPVPVRLKDVATVTLSYRDPEVITRINGEPCVKIDIYKEADANVVEVATNLRRRVFGTSEQQAALKKWREAKGDESNGHEEEDSVQQPEQRPNFLAAALPGDHRLEIMSDQSRFIDRSLDNVRRTAISGGLFAILVLYLFLRHLWFTVAVGLSIPISIVAALVALFLCDVSLNMMSLGGLALGVGMLVDNSIVVLESIFRCREEGDSRVGAAIRGTREVSSAVVASTLTTVSVFLPIVFVEGVAGQVFRDQALAVVLSLLASLIVALYFIPMLASRNLGAPRSGDGGSVRLRFDRRAWRRS
ncbi:MAG: efflux RND transporter permease subunit, partial [Planctomycetes bacterium]|nr:efflux RND transporter permease subunit [Planctomycetota bacterium]